MASPVAERGQADSAARSMSSGVAASTSCPWPSAASRVMACRADPCLASAAAPYRTGWIGDAMGPQPFGHRGDHRELGRPGRPAGPWGKPSVKYHHHAVGDHPMRCEHLCCSRLIPATQSVQAASAGDGRRAPGSDRPELRALVAEAETGSWADARYRVLVPNVMTPIRCPPASPTIGQ